MTTAQKLARYHQQLARARALLARQESQLVMFSFDDHVARLNRLRRRVTALRRTIESLEATRNA